jgi:putative PEP-CTERM system histidine kinase
MTGVAAYGLSAGIAFAAFVWLLFESRDHDLVRRTAFVCLTTAVWAAAYSLQAQQELPFGWSVLMVEAIRYAALFLLMRALTAGQFPPWLGRSGFALCAGICASGLLGWLMSFSLESAPSGAVFSLTGLSLAFVGLVFTEQVIRGGTDDNRRARLVLAAAVGGQFAFDLFLYSQALLLGALDQGAWLLRGAVVAALLLVLAFGVRRMPASTPARVFISRHVVFYSSTFVAVGLYLCLMAVGGYYVREKGGDWGNALQVLFLCGAGGILAWLLLSASPLRRLRVFISTHFYRNKYDYRVEWLRFVQTLSSDTDQDIRATAVHAVARIFGSPGGLLIIRDAESSKLALQASWPAAEVAPEQAVLDANHPLPQFLQQRQWVIDLREYREHPERYGDLQLPRWLPADGEWRVIAPLLVENHLLGFLVLRAPPEPFIMNYEDRDLLKTVGRNVAVQIAQRQADERLAQSRQFDAYNRFAAFVMHDLKNSVAQLQLLVDNADRHRHNPVFVEDAIGTIRNTADRMTRLIGQLQSRDVHGSARVVDLCEIARAAVGRSVDRQPAVSLQACAGALPVHADPDRLGAIIDHVIRNAQEATPVEGKVTLNLHASESSAKLEVIDEGAGMDQDFVRNRLFRPFDSTKGAKGMGIGAYQAREYVRALGGDVEVQSRPGSGTVFSIRLALCATTNPNY